MRKLLASLFALLFGAACGVNDGSEPILASHVLQPDTMIEFTLSYTSPDGCHDCVERAYTDSIGSRRSVYASPQADLTVPGEEVSQVHAWRGPGGSAHINVIFGERATEKIDRLAEVSSKRDAEVLVSVGGTALDVFDPRVLAASHGILALSFSDQQLIESAMGAMGLGRTSLPEVSEEDLLQNCLRFSGDDPERKERCESEGWRKLTRDKNSIRRAEALLEADDPDYEAVLRELGVDPE